MIKKFRNLTKGQLLIFIAGLAMVAIGGQHFTKNVLKTARREKILAARQALAAADEVLLKDPSKGATEKSAAVLRLARLQNAEAFAMARPWLKSPSADLELISLNALAYSHDPADFQLVLDHFSTASREIKIKIIEFLSHGVDPGPRLMGLKDKLKLSDEELITVYLGLYYASTDQKVKSEGKDLMIAKLDSKSTSLRRTAMIALSRIEPSSDVLAQHLLNELTVKNVEREFVWFILSHLAQAKPGLLANSYGKLLKEINPQYRADLISSMRKVCAPSNIPLLEDYIKGDENDGSRKLAAEVLLQTKYDQGVKFFEDLAKGNPTAAQKTVLLYFQEDLKKSFTKNSQICP